MKNNHSTQRVEKAEFAWKADSGSPPTVAEDKAAQSRSQQHCEDPYVSENELLGLEWGTHDIRDNARAIVEDGWVTLEGEVPCSIRRSRLQPGRVPY